MTLRLLASLFAAAPLAACVPAAPAQVYYRTRPTQTYAPRTFAAPTTGTMLRPTTSYAPRTTYAPRTFSTPTVVNGGVVRTSGVQYSAPQVVRAGGTSTYRPTTTYRPTRTAPAGGSMTSGGDQARAQAEANLMARTGNRGHVGGTIGRFEGVGWAMNGTPTTCTPPRGMTLTADAIARGPGGVYRVRAWR